jgi:hypothetical protein
MRYSDSGNGVTRDSLAFYRDHRDRLGDIVSVDVTFPGFDEPYDPYLMRIRDADDNEMRLSGCTTGYPGEGPRATMQILLDEGWPTDWALAAFTDGRLTLSRTPDVERSTAVSRRPPARRPDRAVHSQPRATEHLRPEGAARDIR